MFFLPTTMAWYKHWNWFIYTINCIFSAEPNLNVDINEMTSWLHSMHMHLIYSQYKYLYLIYSQYKYLISQKLTKVYSNILETGWW